MANTDLARLRACVGTEPVLLVSVGQQQGSVPREQGAWMGVTATTVIGTVGGGHLEWEAIAHARALLSDPPQGPTKRHFKLGPSLGQCCGGALDLEFVYQPSDLPAASAQSLFQRLKPPSHPVVLFGGGHVGKALIEVLGRLPMSVLWVDSRDEIFPDQVPANVRCEHSDPVQQAVWDLPAGCHVLMMSFSHAEDLDILAACLQRARQQQDLPYIGLIGSETKWATFRHRLEAKGFGPTDFDRVTCPIGVPGIAGKQPEVIAVAVAAQLLQA